MLLKSPHQGWRSLARRRPILTFMIAILVPHVFAACFNFLYNKTVIIDEVARANPQAVERFELLAAAINATFFPAGLLFLLWLVWPVYRALVQSRQANSGLYRVVSSLPAVRRMPPALPAPVGNGLRAVPLRGDSGLDSEAAERHGVPSLQNNSDRLKAPQLEREQSAPAQSELAEARRRALRLPLFAAVVGMGLWVLAGMGYPLLLPLSGSQKIHFGLSLMVCGLIAGVYPFFGTAYVVVRVFYPALLTVSSAEPREDKQLKTLVWETGIMLVMTVAVPLVGGFMLYVGQKLGLENSLVDMC
jgi:hypothetical protein